MAREGTGTGTGGTGTDVGTDGYRGRTEIGTDGDRGGYRTGRMSGWAIGTGARDGIGGGDGCGGHGTVRYGTVRYGCGDGDGDGEAGLVPSPLLIRPVGPAQGWHRARWLGRPNRRTDRRGGEHVKGGEGGEGDGGWRFTVGWHHQVHGIAASPFARRSIATVGRTNRPFPSRISNTEPVVAETRFVAATRPTASARPSCR
jgi:hypothetical protein